MDSVSGNFMQWVKTPEARKYFFSTHFWGAAANWVCFPSFMLLHLERGKGWASLVKKRHLGVSIANSCNPQGLPLAAIADVMHKDEEFISGPMTFALTSYS